MADPTPPTLAALDTVIDWLDRVRRASGGKWHTCLSLFEDGSGTISVDSRHFGSIATPIEQAYEAVEAYLAGTDEASKALDSEIGENVDHIFSGAPRFPETWCSQCGMSFGPGNHGYSHCSDHRKTGAGR